MWKLLLDRLPSKYNLKKRLIQHAILDSLCPSCQEHEETLAHVFFFSSSRVIPFLHQCYKWIGVDMYYLRGLLITSDSTIRGLIRLGKKIYGSRSGVLQHGHFGIEGVLLFLGKKCLIFTPFYRKFYSILGLGKKKFGKHFKYSFVQWSSQPGACLHGMDYIELSHLIWNWI